MRSVQERDSGEARRLLSHGLEYRRENNAGGIFPYPAK